ncbi:polyamine aminopropyltransferase [Thermodesulfobacteriota bacterium]
MDKAPSPERTVILLGSVFLVAACGLVYELVAGAVSSYILGDAVTQFSLVIGTFLCAMGLGSYLAKFVHKDLLRTFVVIEIWIGLVGGSSSIAMFAASAYAESIFPVFFYCLCACIGILIGVEIPLLIRILREAHGLRGSLSNVLALDYLGALAGSILFPLVVLPYLGLSRSSVVFGLLNLSVAAVGLTLLKESRRGVAWSLVASYAILLSALFFSGRVVGFLEDLLYQDSIVYAQTTRYQRIILTRWRDDTRLYLNGHLQFCSRDEARYHEALVIPAMEASPKARRVLILGGGDGLAAREVLKYPHVQSIDLVDIDPAVTNLARSRRECLLLNKGSLNSPKVRIFNLDAMEFMEKTSDFFDVIIADLPDPSSENLAKLYSRAFYTLCLRRLSDTGVLATQATSPFYARNAFSCIVRTIGHAGVDHPDLPRLHPRPYHINVPP